MQRKIIRIIFFILTSAVLGAGYIIIIYLKTPKSKNSTPKEITADLDRNSIPESYSLKNSRLTISENSIIIWQSPSDWQIDDVIIADSNNDGVLDINLSLWKAGNFGTSRPFWVKANDMSVKNHFFIYNLVNGKIKPIWGSSNLVVPNCEFRVADVNGSGENSLIVTEGEYTQKPACKGNYVAIWKWNGWGFSNEWRSSKGNFVNLKIKKNDGENRIVVDSF
jgi:poly-gamma-glutamate synthesis protein (capsule biosynthesis protein)